MSMTETGLRLCAPDATAALEAVRALSEGRSLPRVLRTVPFVEFRAPVARARQAWEDAPVRLVNTVAKGSRERTRQQFDDFKAITPGKFMSNDFAAWAGIEPAVASTRLGDQAKRGRVKRCGKAGRNVIWRFL